MPKGDAKEGYLNTNAHLETKVAMLERDLAEQCRLLGMGSEREARLMAQLAESQARELRLREALDNVAWHRHPSERPNQLVEKLERFALDGLATPQDDSALREMIEAAKSEEREACAKVCDNERTEFMAKAGENNGRESDFAFGSVNSAERIAAAIRARK